MPFPLAAIGAGLGQGADALMRQQQQYAQQMLMSQAFKEALQMDQARAALGSLPRSAFPQLGSLAGMGNIAGPQAGGMPQQPQGMAPQGTPLPIQQPSFIPPDMDTGRPIAGAAPIPLDDPAAGLPGSEAFRGLGDYVQRSAGAQQAPPFALPPGANPGRYYSVDDPANAGRPGARPLAPASAASVPSAGPSVSEQPAAASSVPATGEAPQTAGATQVPITNPLIQQMMGNRLDLGSVMDSIKQARPGIDPAVAWRATEMLYHTLEKGSAAQQSNAIRLWQQMRLEKEFGVKSEQTGRRLDQGDKRIQTTERGQDMTSATAAAGRTSREGVAAQNRAASMDRLEKRLSQPNVQKALDRADRADKQAVSEMRGRVADIKKRIDVIDMGTMTPQTRADRDRLSREMDDMMGRLNKRIDTLAGAQPAGE